MIFRRKNLFIEFIKNTRPIVFNDCIEWQGAIAPNGYGKIQYKKEQQLVHRVFYEYFKEKIPNDKVIHHTCNNRKCVNPEHLILLSNSLNILLQPKRKFCKRGHELTDVNTYKSNTNNTRLCKICHQKRIKRYKEKRAKLWN